MIQGVAWYPPAIDADLDLLGRQPRGTDRSRVNSRAALIDAAFEEFSTKGYEAATVAGIAERAGVTTGALYAHFTGKLDLLLATVGLTPAEDVVDSIAAMAALPWSEASRIMSHDLATPPDRRRLLLLDLIVVARRDPHVAHILRAGLATYLDAMKHANDKGVALGVIDPALRTDELARLFGLISFGRMVFAALDERPPSDDAFRRFNDLLLQSAGGERDTDQPAELARVRARATTAEYAQVGLRESIVDAVAAGHSLRQVGAAAGLSHERVRQVLRESRQEF
ncbi:MAG TPA: helix-turn-helix domain-containing protein [Acidimicrobiia bacterium]|nr:helix-turn-helix domain-containing protein [Acidimicrobiia bacterium]